MIPPDIKKTLLAALNTARDDSLERAEWSFKGMTPEQMAQQHGQSGNTRQEVLDGYRAARAKLERAEAWVVGGGQ